MVVRAHVTIFKIALLAHMSTVAYYTIVNFTTTNLAMKYKD